MKAITIFFLYINYLLVCLKAFILCFLSVPISFRVPFRLSFSGTFSAIVFQVQMAATETTPEAKQVEHHLEPLIGKTIVLKVSIHCEGCKRKVKKILQGIHGVHDIDIDLRQQKVVVTGNVTSDTLIRRLIAKTGKHAELWPEQANSRKKKQGKTKNREKQSDPAESSEEINQNDNETVKVNVVHGGDASKNVEECNGNTAKSSDGGCGGVNVSKANEGCATGRTGVQLQEVPKPAEVRQTVVLPAGPVTEKKVSSVAVQVDENEASANEKTGGSTSNGGKKKKKKGKANNNNGNEGVTASTATVNVEHCGYGDAPVNRSQGHPGSVPISRPANESPPRHHHIHQHYYAHPPPAAPVYSVSHHTAYPSNGAAYYAPPQPYSYAHVVHPGTEMEPRPYTYESELYSYTPPPSSSSQAPSDSFVLFSDENPNACSVM